MTVLDEISGEVLDWIVNLAETCVRETGAARSDLEESQLRNLQNLASVTDSVAVLYNFLAYQVGRGKIPPEVERQIRKDLESICDRIGQDRKRRMRVIEMYLGFLTRKFVADKKM